jgi:alkaline phosphatase D
MRSSISFLLLWVLIMPMLRLVAQPIDSLPARMWADTAHAPFVYGIASGDPTPSTVIIWTCVRTDSSTLTYGLNWEVATDAQFHNVVKSGTYLTDTTHDFTARVKVVGLQPETYYWYRFRDSTTHYSDTGRTLTAPADTASPSRLRIGVASCSSIYSGFFNAYRRMGERTDMQLWVHLGDYIYDFVDADEKIRIPKPYPSSPVGYRLWSDRHRYYLLDPDFRYVRKMHPCVALWDNHDQDNPNDPHGKRAFFDYTATDLPDSSDVSRIFRTLRYSKLVDLIIIDMYTRPDPTTVPDTSRRILGAAQDAWFASQLQQSQAKWRVIGSEKMMGHWYLNGLPGFTGDNGGWKNHAADRTRILESLRTYGKDNNVFITGDAHVSMAQDLTPNPTNAQAYNSTTGAGSYAVEFLPSSISRGNLDEMQGGAALAAIAIQLDRSSNPHHLYQEFTLNGYGILDITPDSTTAEFWYSPILSVVQTETKAKTLKTLSGANRWYRPSSTTVTDGKPLSPELLGPYPNPAHNRYSLRLTLPAPTLAELDLVDLTGRRLRRLWAGQNAAGLPLDLDLSTEGISPGVYLVRLSMAGQATVTRRLVVE